MKRMLIAALGALLCSGGAAAAQDDDWEFQEDTVRGIAVAAARYEAGQMIIVQCRDRTLTAVLAGLPEAADGLHLEATRADGRTDRQTFLPAGVAGAYRSSLPGRDVRFMRGGGAYTVRTADGAATTFRGVFDLPTESANLDRVLMTCGWAISDERDQIPRAPEAITFRDPEAGTPRMPTRRGATSRAQRREIVLPPPPPVPSEQLTSCIIRDMKATECRRIHGSPAPTPEETLSSERLNGQPVYGVDPAAAEGRVLYTGRALNGTSTVVDFIATIPAG